MYLLISILCAYFCVPLYQFHNKMKINKIGECGSDKTGHTKPVADPESGRSPLLFTC